MKKIAVSDAVCAALQRLASGFPRTPDEVLANLLHLPTAAVSSLSPARKSSKPADPTRRVQSPPPSWAIMNRDPATKRRFLSRVLAFIGYRDDFIDFAGSAIGLTRASPPAASPPPSRRCHGLSCP